MAADYSQESTLKIFAFVISKDTGASTYIHLLTSPTRDPLTMALGFSHLNTGHGAPVQAPQMRKEPLPVEIQLGSNAVKLTREGWKLESRELSHAQRECQRLAQEVSGLRRDLETSRIEARESAEQANMANFQNQLLLDMLAIARADEGVFKKRLGQENARHADLARSLEQAYTQIIAAGLDPGVSDAP